MFGVQPWGAAPWTANRSLDASILASAVEATSAAETSDRLANLAPAMAEVVTASNTQAVIPLKDANEAGFALDAPNVLLMYAWRFQTETTTASDAEQVTMIVARAEPTTATEASDRVMSAAPVGSEVATATDTPNRTATMPQSQTEVGSATEAGVASGTPNVSIIEYIPTKLVPGSYPYTAADLLVYDRNTTATYFDGSGNLQTAAIDTLRFQGGNMLIEATATNVVRNNSMTGAASGSPGTKPTNWLGTLGTTGGVGIRISATGTENGIPYIDLEFNGTATSTTDWFLLMEDLTRQAANLGETWTSSVFSKMVSGSIPGTQPVIAVSGRTSGNVDNDLTETNLNTGTGALSSQRVAATRTMATVGTVSVGPYLRFPLVNGNLYLFTIRIGGPQLELGASATSLIQTTTANVTRLGDDAWPLPQDTKDRAMSAVASRVDTSTATDTENAIQVAVQSDAGTATETESASPLLAWADTVTATDTQDSLMSAAATRTDALTPTESSGSGVVMPVDRSDNTPITDSEAVILIAAVAATDTSTATDTESVVTGMSATRSEPAPVSDTSDAANVKLAVGADAGTVSESSDRTMQANPVQVENAAATDTQSDTVAAQQGANEAAFGTDAVGGGVVTDVAAVDVIGVTDTSGRALVTPVAKVEPTTATDTPNKSMNVPVDRSDTSTPTHSQNAQAFIATGRTDNAPLTEQATQQTATSASRTDASPATDSNVGSTLAEVGRSDTGTVTDTPAIITNFAAQGNESGFASDVPSTATGHSASESTTPTDIYYKHMLAEVDIKELTTPTHTQSSASLFNRWLQEEAYPIDIASVQAFMQAVQKDEGVAVDIGTVVNFSVSVDVHESASLTDAADGVMMKLVEALGSANAQDLQAAAITMVRVVQELNPALDVVAAVSHSTVVMAEGADATDWCAIVIPVGQVDGTDATDACAVFMYETNRMLLLFDKDCHC